MLAVVEQRRAHVPENSAFALTPNNGQRRQPAGGLAAEVRDYNIGPVEHAKAGGLDAAAQVHFFAVEKESGIEEAGFCERLAAQDHECAGDPIYFRRVVGLAHVRWVRQRCESGESAPRGR